MWNSLTLLERNGPGRPQGALQRSQVTSPGTKQTFALNEMRLPREGDLRLPREGDLSDLRSR